MTGYDMTQVDSVEGSQSEALYSILAQMVEDVSSDEAQLRRMVYEFARWKMRHRLYQLFERGDLSAVQEQLQALEAAITRVEFTYAPRALSFGPEPPTEQETASFVPSQKSATAMTILGRVTPAWLLSSSRKLSLLRPAVSDENVPHKSWYPGVRFGSVFWWNIQLIAAVLLGVSIFAVLDGRSVFSLLPTLPATADASANKVAAKDAPPARTPTAIRPSTQNIPLPTDYGAYALSDQKLIKLDTLSMRVPDPRVAISPVIATPSRVHLPAGELQFIVFRRDLLNTAPERAQLRVVAQVVRALTFDSGGKPKITPVEDSWVVRSNAYQMIVAPLAENPEMIMLRPENGALLPAGRYVLVLKGGAYDFTVDGPINDTAHCLERTDAIGAPVYTECRG